MRKLSLRPRLGSEVGGAVFSFSAAGGVAGCDVNGPPPGVGGSGMYPGESFGGGMSVPAVRL